MPRHYLISFPGTWQKRPLISMWDVDHWHIFLPSPELLEKIMAAPRVWRSPLTAQVTLNDD